jgi:hypothetical protein
VRFRVAFVSLDNEDFRDIAKPANAIVSDIDGMYVCRERESSDWHILLTCIDRNGGLETGRLLGNRKDSKDLRQMRSGSARSEQLDGLLRSEIAAAQRCRRRRAPGRWLLSTGGRRRRCQSRRYIDVVTRATLSRATLTFCF